MVPTCSPDAAAIATTSECLVESRAHARTRSRPLRFARARESAGSIPSRYAASACRRASRQPGGRGGRARRNGYVVGGTGSSASRSNTGSTSCNLCAANRSESALRYRVMENLRRTRDELSMKKCTRGYVIIPLLLIGCSFEPPAPAGNKTSGPAPTVLVIESSAGKFTSSTPASLFVSPTTQELRVQGSNGTDVWTAIGTLRFEELSAGTLSITSIPPPVAGSGTVVREGPSGTVQASSGTMSYKLEKGTVFGVVGGTTLDAKISGALSVECWVPETDIPGGSGQQGSVVGEDGVPALSLDTHLASERCAKLRPFAP